MADKPSQYHHTTTSSSRSAYGSPSFLSPTTSTPNKQLKPASSRETSSYNSNTGMMSSTMLSTTAGPDPNVVSDQARQLAREHLRGLFSGMGIRARADKEATHSSSPSEREIGYYGNDASKRHSPSPSSSRYSSRSRRQMHNSPQRMKTTSNMGIADASAVALELLNEDDAPHHNYLEQDAGSPSISKSTRAAGGEVLLMATAEERIKHEEKLLDKYREARSMVESARKSDAIADRLGSSSRYQSSYSMYPPETLRTGQLLGSTASNLAAQLQEEKRALEETRRELRQGSSSSRYCSSGSGSSRSDIYNYSRSHHISSTSVASPRGGGETPQDLVAALEEEKQKLAELRSSRNKQVDTSTAYGRRRRRYYAPDIGGGGGGGGGFSTPSSPGLKMDKRKILSKEDGQHRLSEDDKVKIVIDSTTASATEGSG